MSETNNSKKSELVDNNEPRYIDAEWFDEFTGIESNHVFEYFSGDTDTRVEQRRAFDGGEISNPSLDYPEIDLKELQDKEMRFLELKAKVLGGATEPDSLKEAGALKQIYRWSINERLAENRMVQEVAKARDADTPSARAHHMKRFERYNDFLYGPQNEDVFGYYANGLRSEALKLKDEGDTASAAVAGKVLALFPEHAEVSFDIPALNDADSRRSFRETVLSEYGLSIDSVKEFIETEGDMSAEQLAAYFVERQAQVEGAERFATFAEEDRTVSTFNAIREDLRIATVRNGVDRSYTPSEALKLDMHENSGGHLARSAGGYNSKLKILGVGMDRNEKPDEGNSMFGESAIDEEGDPNVGWAGVIAVGIARGLDKPKSERDMAKRDFAGTEDALKAIYEMKALTAGKSPEDASKIAANNSWNRSVRTFRGTTCDVPGVVYQKDVSYGEGFLETHAFFEADSGRLALLKFGKFNAMNGRHIKVLLELGILDEDLAALAE